VVSAHVQDFASPHRAATPGCWASLSPHVRDCPAPRGMPGVGASLSPRVSPVNSGLSAPELERSTAELDAVRRGHDRDPSARSRSGVFAPGSVVRL